MKKLKLKILPRNLSMTKKQIITKTLRANSRVASLLLCVVALMTCVSVTFAWFGSTFENLNTVITMGDYSADISVYDADGNQVESKSASNGENVSFDNTQTMSGWSSGDVCAYYIYAHNTGDIDIKTYLSFASEFVSNSGSNYSENKQHFAFVVKDITKDCNKANGVLSYIKKAQLPSAEYIRENGKSFAESSSTLAGNVEGKNSGVFALYYCCYDLPNEYVSSNYSFILNTQIITSQAGMPESELQLENSELNDVLINSMIDTNPVDTEPAETQTKPQPSTQVTTNNQNTASPSAKNEWVWEYNDTKNKTVTLTEYNGRKTDIILPSLVDGHLVTMLGDNLLKNSAVTKVTVPACVTSFGTNTFNSVKTVVFQTRTTVSGKIYTSPFKSEGNAIYTADMTSLVRYLPQSTDKEFVVPVKVTAIYDNAFSGCSKLEAISVKNVDYFGTLTLAGTSIKNINLYNNEVVMSAGDSVFGNKSYVTIHVLSTMENAYKSASSVSGYKLKADLKSDIYQLYPRTEINGLKYLILKNGDEYNGTVYSFKGYSEFVIINGYTSVPDDGVVIVPETIICDGKVYHVAAIADGAFKNCKKLKTLVLPNQKVAYSSKAFEGCDNLGLIQNNDVLPYTPGIKENAALNVESETKRNADPSDGGDAEPTE